MGKPRGLAAAGRESEILELRRLVLAGPAAEDEPPSIDVLRGRIADLWRLYWTGRYAGPARDLPGALHAGAGLTRDATTDDGRRAGWAAVAELPCSSSLPKSPHPSSPNSSGSRSPPPADGPPSQPRDRSQDAAMRRADP